MFPRAVPIVQETDIEARLNGHFSLFLSDKECMRRRNNVAPLVSHALPQTDYTNAIQLSSVAHRPLEHATPLRAYHQHVTLPNKQAQSEQVKKKNATKT